MHLVDGVIDRGRPTTGAVVEAFALEFVSHSIWICMDPEACIKQTWDDEENFEARGL